MKQSTRIELAQSTLAILKQGFYVNSKGETVHIDRLQRKAEDSTRLFTPEVLERLMVEQKVLNKYATEFEVTNETTLDAARRLTGTGAQDVICLNFASAKNPGGGFLGGALAQEECIARASGLYPCLLNAEAYYQYHRTLNTCLYSDHMIYSLGVPVIMDEEGVPLDKPVCIAIITSPAVNAGVVKRQEPGKISQIIPVMKVRIEKLLTLGVHYRHDNLVLGAWGCGVFQNEPEDIAQLFLEALTGRFEGCFKKIVFAVKTDKERVIGPFKKRFML